MNRKTRMNAIPAGDSLAGTDIVPTAASGLSRRGLLAGLGIGSLGLLAAPDLLGCTTKAAAATTTKLTNRPKALKQPGLPVPAKQAAALGADGKYNPVGPFTTAASCELSEDFFLTDEVLIDPTKGDKIMPFTNSSTGQVEAVVLSNNTLNHLRRDPSNITGWSYEQIPPFFPPNGGVSDAAVAVGSDGTAVIMAMDIASENSGNTLTAIFSLTPAGTWQVTTTNPDFKLDGPLQAGTTGAGEVYFYSWTEGTNAKAKTMGYEFYIFDTKLNSTNLAAAAWPMSAVAGMTDAKIIYNAAGPDGTTGTWAAVTLLSAIDQSLAVSFYQVGGGIFGSQIGGPGNVAELLAAAYTPANTSGTPALLWQTSQGDVEFIDESGAQANLYAGSNSGAGQVAYWQINGEYTFAILEDSQLNIVHQFGSGGQSGFTQAIPMLGGIGSVYSVPTDASEATLFAIDLDSGVSALTRSDSGWTQSVIHQDGATTNQVSAYRIRLSALDANNIQLANGQVRLTPDRPVGIWIDGSHSIWATPDIPATVTLSGSGQLLLAVPADELDTAVIMAQAIDSTGAESGPAFTITPNIDVQNFLAGNASLTNLGMLDGQTLLNANSQSWDWNKQTYANNGSLFTGLTNLPAADQTDAANSVAYAIHHVATIGLGAAGVPGPSNAQSSFLDLTQSAPTFTMSPSPDAFTPPASADTSWWESAQNDADSVFHGIRHGEIELKQLFTKWDEEAKQWIVNLVVNIGNDINHLINTAIKDVKSAIHAISGFFHALGADIKQAWDWLKNKVLELIRDAESNSTVLEGFLGQLSTEMIKVVNTIKIDTDTFFTDLTDKVNTEIGNLYTEADKAMFGDAGTLPPPPPDSGSDDSDLDMKIAGDIFKVLQHAPAMWLLNKVEAHLPGFDTTVLSDIDYTVFQAPLADAVAAIQKAVDTAEAAGEFLWDAFKDVASPSDMGQAQLTTLFEQFRTMTDDVLAMFDDIADFVLDLITALMNCLDDLFTAEFPPIPLLGEVLELVGIDATMSIQHLMCLVVSYPATLIAMIATGGGMLFPTSSQSGPASAKTASSGTNVPISHFIDPWAVGMNTVAAVIQTIWALDDFVVDCFNMDPTPDVPDVLNIVDFVCPALLTVVQWPTPPTLLKTAPPFQYDNFEDSTLWGDKNNLLPGILVTGGVPWAFEAVTFVITSLTGVTAAGTFVNDNITPVIQGMGGIANNVMAAMYAYANAGNAAQEADAIIAATVPNLSYTFAFMVTTWMKSVSDNWAPMLHFFIDCFGNFGAVAIYLGQAAAAFDDKPPSEIVRKLPG